MITAARVHSLVDSFHDPSDGWGGRELVLLLEGSSAPFSRSQFMPGDILYRPCPCPRRRAPPAGFTIGSIAGFSPGAYRSGRRRDMGHTASREVVEETCRPPSGPDPPLVGIDVHGVPARREEPYHLASRSAVSRPAQWAMTSASHPNRVPSPGARPQSSIATSFRRMSGWLTVA
jgi:hypothetical protein